jgi:uncharacterized protein (DUF58 family)
VRAGLARFFGRPRPAAVEGSTSGRLRDEVRRLEVRARQAMDTGLAGQYQSAFRGLGLEYQEVGEYRYGDDVRTVDWNVTARTGRLHVKRYREERDLHLLLLVDLSASTRSGSGVMTVHDLIAEVAGLFALAAARRDRVGAVLFDDRVRKVIPPRSGPRHGQRVVREVLAASPAGRGTASEEALAVAGRLLRRRGVVVVVSDARCRLPRRQLVTLAGRHDVVVVRATDPLLESGSPVGPVAVVDGEEGVREFLDGAVGRPDDDLPATVDVLELSTAEDYLPALRAMLGRRERRRAG